MNKKDIILKIREIRIYLEAILEGEKNEAIKNDLHYIVFRLAEIERRENEKEKNS